MKKYKVIFVDSKALFLTAKSKSEAEREAARIRHVPILSVSIVRE